ncbi:LysR family transcriptional regulator [Seohaeicola nanhaiensis]|uniref:LysR family transcriptional regulator n=1 Tax=Seohaeicola nanhaiensis TaxID=1387282 RepID=A0ABV9KC86_9RHOB
MTRINLNALHIFAAVARHGNLQRAAEELNLTRGAVSQRLKQLELDLGVVLVERHARGVTLTSAGERCRTAVDAAMTTLDAMVQDLGAGAGQVTLHLGSSTAAKWLMPRMADFAARFPRVSLTTEVHTRLLSRDLARNEIAIWPGRSTDPTPFRTARALTPIRLVAVASPRFPRPAGPLDLETLLTLPLLQDAHRRWERLIAATGHRTRHRILNFDRSALALDAAIGGHGVAIAPSYLVAHDLQAQRLAPLWRSPDPPEEHLFVSWSDVHGAQPEVRRIVDWIAAGFAPDRPPDPQAAPSADPPD